MTLKGHKPETPDWKRSTKIIQSVIDSIEPSALVSMREYAASVVSDGKRPRCGKLIRRESSKTLCRLKSACTLYSSTANHEQFETVCKMICGVISIPSCKSCGIKFYGPGTFCSRDCIQSNFQLGTKERNARREATCLKKYGSSHVSKVEKLKAFQVTVDHINRRLDALLALDTAHMSRPELIAAINQISHIE